jgi:regulator of RNase E activity RraA
MTEASSPPKLPRVQIVNRQHPHFEEYGRFTGKIITLRFNGEDMAEVHLENCRHGTDVCFVGQRDVRQVPER